MCDTLSFKLYIYILEIFIQGESMRVGTVSVTTKVFECVCVVLVLVLLLDFPHFILSIP